MVKGQAIKRLTKLIFLYFCFPQRTFLLANRQEILIKCPGLRSVNAVNNRLNQIPLLMESLGRFVEAVSSRQMIGVIQGELSRVHLSRFSVLNTHYKPGQLRRNTMQEENYLTTKVLEYLKRLK